MSNKKKDTLDKNQNSKKLADYLNSLSRPEMMLMITNISNGCMVPRYTVMNWKYGLARIPSLHRCKIEEIIGKNIFN